MTQGKVKPRRRAWYQARGESGSRVEIGSRPGGSRSANRDLTNTENPTGRSGTLC